MNELSRRLDSWASTRTHAPAEQPGDEWDCLLGPVVALLAQQRPAEEIALRISAELHDHYGLDAPRDDVSFASELRLWWDADAALGRW